MNLAGKSIGTNLHDNKLNTYKVFCWHTPDSDDDQYSSFFTSVITNISLFKDLYHVLWSVVNLPFFLRIYPNFLFLTVKAFLPFLKERIGMTWSITLLLFSCCHFGLFRLWTIPLPLCVLCYMLVFHWYFIHILIYNIPIYDYKSHIGML